MLSKFFVLSQRGDSIITRELRGDEGGSSEIFFRKVKFWKGDAPPIFCVDGVNYCFVKRNGIFFVVTTRRNVSPSFIIELMNQVVKVFKDFCGVLNEETLRRNYVLIYELLDEMLDFGCPQGMSSEALRSYVFNDPIAPSVGLSGVVNRFRLPDINPKTTPSSSVFKPIAVTDRRSTRNEVFVDIAERISAVFNPHGHVINSEIQGCVQMKSYLVGNPELRLALNPELTVGRGNGPGYGVVLDDCNFHECVRLENFENNKELFLIPPDGEFVAMNYRVTSPINNPPFHLYPIAMEINHLKIELTIRIKAEMGDNNYGCNLSVTFPVPKHTSSVSFTKTDGATQQRTEYKPKQQVCVWKMKRMNGTQETTLTAKISLSQAATALTKKELGPFSFDFEIPMFNMSGVNVKFLEILQNNTKNKPYRWVRYVTYSNSYVIRM